MTNKKAIDQLKHMKVFIGYDAESPIVKEMQSALDMAIKALEQTELNPSYNSIKTELKPCGDATNNGLKLERHTVTTSSEQKELINALFNYDNELIDKVFDVGEKEIYFESDLIFDGEKIEWKLKRSKVDDIISKIEQARDKDKIAEYPYNRCIKIIREVLGDD